jgi:class 3 adenylate cyclase
MPRYLKASLLTGVLVSLLVVGALVAGWLRGLDEAWLGLLEFPPTLAPESTWLGPGLVYGLPLLAAFGLAWTTIDVTQPGMKLLLAAGFLGLVGLLSYTLSLFGIPYSPVGAWIAGGLSMLAGMVYSSTEGGQRKRVLRATLANRISPESFNELLNAPTPPNFQGELTPATVLVCGIYNQTSLLEALEPAQSVELVNRFLQETTSALAEAGAYIDAVDGESVRVIFGNLLNRANHAQTACAAALTLKERLDRLNRELEDRWRHSFDYRMSIESGDIVSAAYGTHNLGGYSVAGPAVDRARRLCGANLTFGTRILLGTGAFDLAESIVAVRPIELLHTHNQPAPSEVYELVALKAGLPETTAKRLEEFWKAVIYFREGSVAKAREIFQGLQDPDVYDGLLEHYLRRVNVESESPSAIGVKLI